MESSFIEIFTEIGKSQLESISAKTPFLEKAEFNKAIDFNSRNMREFGLKECTMAAERIFTPEVINNWGKMSPEQRISVTKEYASCVAEAFELVNFKGVSIEAMDGKNGYNRGDGVVHLSSRLIYEQSSPLQVVDTVTHELRHQYQIESIHGFHYIPEDTRQEWKAGLQAYTPEMPWSEDPWGYKYNPLEIDSRYAAETVVREMTKDLVNGKYA